MSSFLKALENEVQVLALLFMAGVYIVRLFWIFRFRKSAEMTLPAGSKLAGIAYSSANFLMPWALEQRRRNLFFYVQFAVFHLGVAASITLSFLIPYAPGVLNNKLTVLGFRVVLAAAFLVGVKRTVRRLTDMAVRTISTPDDHFSLWLLTLYFASAFLAAPNRYQESEVSLIIFFGLTAFFLIYVPFSKISHYLYYPINRYFLGKSLGHRGVYKTGTVFFKPGKE